MSVSDGTHGCVAQLSDGAGSCHVSETATGRYNFDAIYTGSSNFAASGTSVETVVNVAKATTRTVFKLSSSKVTYGAEQAEHLSVTVSPEFAGDTVREGDREGREHDAVRGQPVVGQRFVRPAGAQGSAPGRAPPQRHLRRQLGVRLLGFRPADRHRLRRRPFRPLSRCRAPR